MNGQTSQAVCLSEEEAGKTMLTGGIMTFLKSKFAMFAIVMGLTSTALGEWVRVGNWDYYYNILDYPAKTAELIQAQYSGYVGDITVLNIPGEIDGYKIVSIGRDVFWSCSYVTTVNIGEGVESIGEDVFRTFHDLKSVSLPSTIKTISSGAFWAGNGPLRIEISDIGKWCGVSLAQDWIRFNSAFQLYYKGNPLVNLVIPVGVKEISAYTFAGSENLKSVKIPSGVTLIDDDAFQGCRNLSRIDIADLSQWFSLGFNTSYNYRLYVNNTELTEVTIPSNVMRIPSHVFKHCASLKCVIIPEGVLEIGSEAFSNCQALKEVRVPASVTTIENGAFSRSPSLSTIDVASSNIAFAATGGVLYDAIQSRIIFCSQALTNVVIPASVRTIG